MRRAALPFASCLVAAAANAQTSPPAPPPIMVPDPPPPQAPRPAPRPLPSEAAEAVAAARLAEQLMRERRFDDAIANYRTAIDRPLGAEPALIWWLHSLHAQLLANRLIWAERLDDADRLLLAHLERGRAVPDPDAHRFDDELVDMRLYIAAGRGNAAELLALIDQRDSLNPGNPRRVCISRPWFPEVVAPMHHVPEVAAKLRAIGCDDNILGQLDRLAARPIGEGHALTLPPRSSEASASAE